MGNICLECGEQCEIVSGYEIDYTTGSRYDVEDLSSCCGADFLPENEFRMHQIRILLRTGAVNYKLLWHEFSVLDTLENNMYTLPLDHRKGAWRLHGETVDKIRSMLDMEELEGDEFEQVRQILIEMIQKEEKCKANK